MIRRLLREPLLHFLALGAVLFVLFARVGGDDPGGRLIVVGRGTIDHLAATYQLTWQRPPTPAELDALVADYVREQIYAREARALGFDQDDVVVNRRLRQKMEVLAASAAEQEAPSEAELETWRREHEDRYREEPRVTFRHVYLSRERRGAATDGDAARLLAALRAGADPAALGDPILLPAELREARLSDVAQQLGEAFAARVGALDPGAWAGPLESPYGVHLVRVESRTEGRSPPLVEVRDAVLRDWQSARIDAAEEAFYQSLRDRYQVSIER